MDAPVRHHAACIVPKPAKIAEEFIFGIDSKPIFVKRPPGSGAEPHIPVESRRRISIGRISHSFNRGVADVPGLYARDLPELAGTDQFHRTPEVIARTLLCSGLHHALVPARSLHHFLA